MIEIIEAVCFAFALFFSVKVFSRMIEAIIKESNVGFAAALWLAISFWSIVFYI